MNVTIAKMLYGGFYYCPTTGRIIEALYGDDKVLCKCRTSNPMLPEEQTHRTGTHVIRYLKPAPVEDYVRQCNQGRQS